MPDLFEPLAVGSITLPNRVLFAPCTRHRANLDETATPIMIEYYGQRASAGLIISEGINPSTLGRGYYHVPALNNSEQEGSWRPITSAVSARGGAIFAQLMHAGRLSFPELLDGRAPIGASGVRPDPDFRGYTVSCPRPKEPYPTPKALDEKDVRLEITRFADAAARAVAAGFAGVEIHAGNGYMPIQFLSSNTNCRSDRYGGSIAKRSRFLLEIIDEVAERIGRDKVGVKLSPGFQFSDVRDDDPVGLYTYVTKCINDRRIAYLHVSDLHPYYGYDVHVEWYPLLRNIFEGVFIVNGGIGFEQAQQILSDGAADAVAFGSAFIANPDLPARFRAGAPLNVPRPELFYTQEAEGYTDYPRMDELPSSHTAADYRADFADLQPGT
ncbi:alkene reductase [Arthrobacter sp. ISL-28]|nr:alkene reductase [Arthrobacter sp. ISL-28]